MKGRHMSAVGIAEATEEISGTLSLFQRKAAGTTPAPSATPHKPTPQPSEHSFCPSKGPTQSFLNHTHCSCWNQSCNIFIFCSFCPEPSTPQHIQTQRKPETQAGYSLVLGLNVHIKVRLKALGNNAMERIVRDLWLLWLQGNISNVGSNLPWRSCSAAAQKDRNLLEIL